MYQGGGGALMFNAYNLL